MTMLEFILRNLSRCLLVACILLAGILWTKMALAQEGRKVALLVGNTHYDHIDAVPRAVVDARALGEILKEDLGFQSVQVVADADALTFGMAFDEFLIAARGADLAFFAFTGQGRVVKGESMLLLPTDVPNVVDMLLNQGRRLSDLMELMGNSGARLSVLLVDACRTEACGNDDLTRSAGSAVPEGRGLARISVPHGTYVVLSAGAGQTALDGLSSADPDPHSLFMRNLLPELVVPGRNLDEAVKVARQKTYQAALDVGHQQLPTIHDETTSLPILLPATHGHGDKACAFLRRNNSVKELLNYLEARPDGACGLVARARLTTLRSQGETLGSRLLSGSRIKDCQSCPEMVVLPRGGFVMGSASREEGRSSHEGPQHRVVVDYDLAVGTTEVTVRQYRQFVEDTGYKSRRPCGILERTTHGLEEESDWRSNASFAFEDYPVGCVDWRDVQAYITWLNGKLPPGEVAAAGIGPYRLPTEAEWEYAARGGSGPTLYPWGSDPTLACIYANVLDVYEAPGKGKQPSFHCLDKVGNVAEVGRFQPNGFGLKDMIGNQWEWVADCYVSDYGDVPWDGSAMKGDDKCDRVVRGGSWLSPDTELRSSARRKLQWYLAHVNVGFRVARNLP